MSVFQDSFVRENVMVRGDKFQAPTSRQGIAGVVRRAARCLVALLVLAVAGEAHAAGTQVSWTGGAGTGNWATAANWASDPSALGATFSPDFAGSIQLTTTNSTFSALTRITFLANAGAFTLNGTGTGATVALSDRIDNLSTRLQTINFNLSYAAVERIDAVASGTNLINGSISGAGGITINGGNTTGMTILTASNSYAGATTVTAGVLNIRDGNALGTTAGATSVTAGGALELQNNITVGAEALTLNGAGISSTGALRNVAGTNTYSGTVTLGSASTIGADAGTTLNLTSVVTGNFTKTFDGAGSIVASGTVVGSGGVTKSGAGLLTLSATNTFTGALAVNSGTVRRASR